MKDLDPDVPAKCGAEMSWKDFNKAVKDKGLEAYF